MSDNQIFLFFFEEFISEGWLLNIASKSLLISMTNWLAFGHVVIIASVL